MIKVFIHTKILRALFHKILDNYFISIDLHSIPSLRSPFLLLAIKILQSCELFWQWSIYCVITQPTRTAENHIVHSMNLNLSFPKKTKTHLFWRISKYIITVHLRKIGFFVLKSLQQGNALRVLIFILVYISLS